MPEWQRPKYINLQKSNYHSFVQSANSTKESAEYIYRASCYRLLRLVRLPVLTYNQPNLKRCVLNAIRPALRGRLAQHHSEYFGTSDFALYFQRYFKFNWPFSFDDTYRYCSKSKTYHASPLFKQYHINLRSWVIDTAFFERFPELAEDILVPYTSIPHAPVSPGILPIDSLNTNLRSCADAKGGHNYCSQNGKLSDSSFGDTSLMAELFSCIPRTE